MIGSAEWCTQDRLDEYYEVHGAEALQCTPDDFADQDWLTPVVDLEAERIEREARYLDPRRVRQREYLRRWRARKSAANPVGRKAASDLDRRVMS